MFCLPHLDYGHDEVDEVGHPAELLEGVEHPEGQQRVLGALDVVRAKLHLKQLGNGTNEYKKKTEI